MINLVRLRILAVAVTPLALGACSWLSENLSGNQVDYKSAGQSAPRPRLEVPPGLDTLPPDNRYDIPKEATLSSFNQQRSQTPVAATGPQVLPKVEGAHMERAGSQRWLVVNLTPEQLWPVLKEFWQDQGFLIKTDSPQTGVMETDWAENRAKLPQDLIRRTIGSVLDDVYDTGTRDKFRTRLERSPNGGTEIYISHRGMIEVITSQQSNSTIWTARPSDPELEAEFLRRLLVRLGDTEEKAKAVVASVPAPGTPAAAGQPSDTHLVAQGANSYLDIPDAFDRAWRRVGLALDRSNFTVVDRDRSKGIYYVRYVDPKTDAPDRGLFAKLFESSDKDKIAIQYQVVLNSKEGGPTRIVVESKDGKSDVGDAAARILALLNDQLK